MHPLLNVKQLRHFVTIAEERQFTRAAEQLGIAQPPLSQSIARLESALGFRLLDRSRAGVTLTPAGQSMYREAKAALLQLDKAARVAAELRDTQLRREAHAALYHHDPEAGHQYPFRGKTNYPACLLTMTDRKSGDPVETPLLYARNGDDVVVVGLLSGTPTNPGWYDNLVANPLADIQIKYERWRVRARVAKGAERERLWKIATDVGPIYEEFQSQAQHKLPVVVLERINAPGASDDIRLPDE